MTESRTTDSPTGDAAARASGPANPPRFLDAGEAALVVEFGDRVDPALNEQVLALDAALAADSAAGPVPGLAETVPTYRSLMIHYDPLVLSRAALVAAVEARLAAGVVARGEGRCWTIPCCYDPALAEDIAEAAGLIGREVAAVAELHAGARYRVYMYGFAPGFAYLGGLPEALALPRRPVPRPPHPPGAVMIGGGLAAIGTFPMPTGWYVLARTPERLFTEGRAPAFLIESGDTLRFEPVDAATFADLERRAAAGEIVARRET